MTLKCPKCKRPLRTAKLHETSADGLTYEVTAGEVCVFCKVIVWSDKDLSFLARPRT